MRAPIVRNDTIWNSDWLKSSIEEARKHAKEHNVSNIGFQTREAKDLPGKYDLITMFDCLHDMGDPVGALKHVRAALKPNGSVMIVEPMAGDSLKDNLSPIGRMYYSSQHNPAAPRTDSKDLECGGKA